MKKIPSERLEEILRTFPQQQVKSEVQRAIDEVKRSEERVKQESAAREQNDASEQEREQQKEAQEKNDYRELVNQVRDRVNANLEIPDSFYDFALDSLGEFKNGLDEHGLEAVFKKVQPGGDLNSEVSEVIKGTYDFYLLTLDALGESDVLNNAMFREAYFDFNDFCKFSNETKGIGIRDAVYVTTQAKIQHINESRQGQHQSFEQTRLDVLKNITQQASADNTTPHDYIFRQIDYFKNSRAQSRQQWHQQKSRSDHQQGHRGMSQSTTIDSDIENHLKTLGVEPKNATQDAIKSAYKKEALKWHPDKKPENDEANDEAVEKFRAEKFIKAKNAKEFLSDPKNTAAVERFRERAASLDAERSSGPRGP